MSCKVNAKDNQMFLLPTPGCKGFIKMLDNRFGFDTPTKILDDKIEWICVYGNHGVSLNRLGARPMLHDLVQALYIQLLHSQDAPMAKDFYVLFLARVIDAVHTNAQLQASVLTNPRIAGLLIRKKLDTLGYGDKVDFPMEADGAQVNVAVTLEVLDHIMQKLMAEMCFYFEFTAPDKSLWRAGNSNKLRFLIGRNF
jgi:hypothetical protein